MTPLDRLADVVAEMTARPWRPDIDSSLRHGSAWAVGPEREDTRAALRDAAGIAALRNVADALIDVARAARRVSIEQEGPATEVEHELIAALFALNTAITKALGEGT